MHAEERQCSTLHTNSGFSSCFGQLPGGRLTADVGQRRGKGGEDKRYKAQQRQLHHQLVQRLGCRLVQGQGKPLYA